MASDILPRKPPQAPPRFTTSPASLLQATERVIERTRSLQDAIVSTITADTATFGNVIVPLAQAENSRISESRLLGFYRSVSPDPGLREASAKAHCALEDFVLESNMREDLFRLVNAVTEKQGQRLDPESRHLLSRMHGEFVKNGLKLAAGPQRDRFREIQRRINTLAAEFVENAARAATGGVWYDREELPGLPDSILSTMDKGSGTNEGKVFATFRSHKRPILRLVSNPESRKKVFLAHANGCNENIPIFREVTVLRDEAARLLGCPSHAALVLQDKVAREPATVNALLDDLVTRLRPAGLREVGRYKKLKQAHCEAEGQLWDGRYFIWDQPFYNRKLLATTLMVDHEEVSQYFPLETTLADVLETFQHLFSLVFVEMPPNSGSANNDTDPGFPVWHDDVLRFGVWDSEPDSDEFLGYLYMDLFSRDFKRSGASNFSLIPGFTRSDGSRNHPCSALICNFSRPSNGSPCLLQHEDVLFLFHELGHSIHDLVSKTTYARFHGSAGTAVDFGEAPSQMLENWCWSRTQLKSWSRHYSSLSADHLKTWLEQQQQTSSASQDPGKHIHDHLLDGLLASKDVHPALSWLNQLHIAIFDMVIHEPDNREAMLEMNISETYNRLGREIFPLDTPWVLGEGDEWGHTYTGFTNLIASDYHAGYYGYALSNVFSSDIFDTFFKTDPGNAAEGRRYRHQLLEKGGSRPEMETLVAYLGREPSPKALYRELGLW